jgi:hypothetical protein
MRKDDSIRLHHMLDAAKEAESFSQDKTRNSIQKALTIRQYSYNLYQNEGILQNNICLIPEGKKMDKQIVDKVVKYLDDFPESKITSLLDYIEFLKQDEFTEEEKRIILESAREKNGVPWEDIRRNV